MVEGLKGFVPPGFRDQMIEFEVPEIAVAFNAATRGISAESFIEICRAYVTAFDANALTTERQKEAPTQKPRTTRLEKYRAREQQ